MDNYGEELGYWYLRLNGFFPITNFVLHSLRKDNCEKPYNADVDLLAIRPPDACEEIEGYRLKWDPTIVPKGEQSNYIFVYCEVKTGNYEVEKLFPDERIEYVKKRCGLASAYRKSFCVTNNENNDIKKVLIANKKEKGVPNDIVFIFLKDVISYIRGRFKEYDEYKYPSRMFFKSSLIQLLIHEEKESLEREEKVKARIVIDDRIRHGKPIIKRTRITVDEVLGVLIGGMSYEEIESEYGIEKEDILAVIEYTASFVRGEEN